MPCFCRGGGYPLPKPHPPRRLRKDYHPSVLLHCWFGHLTFEIVSEMTYNVSSGTLNPTIPYQRQASGAVWLFGGRLTLQM